MTAALPVWKLTRTAPARRLYDTLVGAGLRVSILDRFRRDLAEPSKGAAAAPPEVEIELVVAADCPVDWAVEDPGLEPPHFVVGALADGELVGVALLSEEGPVFVEPLDRIVAFDGGYIWGLDVDPSWRRRGIASTLVSLAIGHLGELGVSAVDALIAPDNVPSRSLFRAAEFRPISRHTHINAFGVEHRCRRRFGREGDDRRPP